MENADKEDEMQLNYIINDEKAGSDESNDEITQIDRRKDVMNTVLEKLIDTINQPQKS